MPDSTDSFGSAKAPIPNSTGSPAETPQFHTAEYAPPAGVDVCKLCRQPIAGQYYRVNGNMACPSCADAARRNQVVDTHSAFVRAVSFGIGAAIVGLIGYATVAIITGLNIGFVSLAVGYIVAAAMMKGSGGIGGKRYRIVAVLLTYFAVSVAAVPVAIYQIAKQKPRTTQSAGPQASSDSDSSTQQQPPEKMGAAGALGILILYGLASPFLELQDPIHGFIGLIILLVGMQIAWKKTAGQPQALVDGPF